MRPLPVILSLILCSCSFSSKDYHVTLGGKTAYNGRDFSVTTDHEKSFSDGAILAGVAVGAAQAVAVQRSSDGLSKTVNSNATKQAINASNNATAVELGAQATSLETVKATTLPK